MAAVAVLDDRLLVEELLVGLPHEREELRTARCWYYRACRAAVLGAGGHLSGPFAREPAEGILPGVLDHECGRSRIVTIE